MTYVYGLVDPRDGLVHYIGKTIDPEVRLAQHFTERRWEPEWGDTPAKSVWLQELDAAGLRPWLLILGVAPADGWPAVEAEWVRRAPLLGWSLVNHPRDSALRRTS